MFVDSFMVVSIHSVASGVRIRRKLSVQVPRIGSSSLRQHSFLVTFPINQVEIRAISKMAMTSKLP